MRSPPSLVVSPEHIRDLGERWGRARAQVLRSAAMLGEARSVDHRVNHSEPDLLRAALAVDASQTLRAVFDASLALGRSFTSHFGLVLERSDLERLLGALGVECAARTVEQCGDGTRLCRSACSGSHGGSPLVCDFYREALDGLVLGLCDGEVHHRRHRSAGHGDDHCVDVLFESGRAGDALRFGALPPELAEQVALVAERLARFPGIAVRFRGMSEGVLGYEVVSASAELAADGIVERALSRQLPRVRFPHLRFQNVAPRAVLAPEP